MHRPSPVAERVGDICDDSRKPNVYACFLRNRLRSRDLVSYRLCPSLSSSHRCYRILFLQWHSKWCSTGDADTAFRKGVIVKYPFAPQRGLPVRKHPHETPEASCHFGTEERNRKKNADRRIDADIEPHAEPCRCRSFQGEPHGQSRDQRPLEFAVLSAKGEPTH